jgi:ABC-2 type transport system ATP-binding protein
MTSTDTASPTVGVAVPGGIAVRRVSKSLRGTEILRDIDLTVPPSAVAVVEGANGAGKTTLIRILSTVVSPDVGSALVNGYDTRAESRQVRRSIGVAFVNDRSLYWRIDGVRNLVLFGRLAGLSKSVIAERIPPLLEALRLATVAHERVARMSTGQRQRLMLARALLVDPPVLLLDEPLRGLDDEGLEATLSLLQQRARSGCTVLVVAPLVTELLAVADSSYRLIGGCLMALDETRKAGGGPP